VTFKQSHRQGGYGAGPRGSRVGTPMACCTRSLRCLMVDNGNRPVRPSQVRGSPRTVWFFGLRRARRPASARWTRRCGSAYEVNPSRQPSRRWRCGRSGCALRGGRRPTPPPDARCADAVHDARAVPGSGAAHRAGRVDLLEQIHA